MYIFLFFIGFLMFPILIPRKHMEYKLMQWVPSFWFVVGVVQMHNNIYEELGKLLAMAIPFWIFRKSLKPLIFIPRNAILLGFWVGLGYGVGETVTLTLIAYKPSLGKLAGISLMWLFVTWNWVTERAMAVLLHGILGGFVGLSLYFLLKRRWLKGLAFFIVALLYHELVDGTVLFMKYHMAGSIAQFLLNNFLYIVLPIYVIIGLLALLWAFLKFSVEKDVTETYP